MEEVVSREFRKTVYGVGYLGIGCFKAYLNRKPTPEYVKWTSILRRCYSEEFLFRNPSYRGCTVHKDWHNFQNFSDWYVNHEFYGLGYEVDKDILILGNRVYGSEGCSLVPKELNLLLNRSMLKSSSFPQGVYLDKTTGLYKASICKYGKTVGLGYFESPYEAYEVYILEKDSHIKEVTGFWVGKVENKVLQALNSWKLNQSQMLN